MVKVKRVPDMFPPPYYELDDLYPALVGSTTDNAIVRFDGTTGQLQNSIPTIDDDGRISVAAVANGDKLVMFGTAGDAGAYAVGIEASTLYYKSGSTHRWYCGVNADGGTSDVMQLTSTAYAVNVAASFASSLSVFSFSATGASNGKNVGTNAILESSRSISTAAGHLTFYNPNGQVGSITTSASATSYNTSSDERLKDGFEDFDAGQIIDAISIYRYQWKVDGTLGYGPKAQELYHVFPQAVNVGSVGDMPGDDGFAPWGYDASKLVPLMLREIQALRARLAALEAR